MADRRAGGLRGGIDAARHVAEIDDDADLAASRRTQCATADPAAFARYSRALLDGLNGVGPALGISGENFGYQLRSGRYAGVASFHKFGNDVDGPTLLGALLDRSLPDAGGRTVAEVVRDLWRRDQERGLSAGEKRMLAKARQILVGELALAESTDDAKAETILDEVLAAAS